MRKSNADEMRILLLCAFAMLMAQCGVVRETADALPREPDYADTAQWYVTDRSGAADLFYIVSTETGDYPLPDGSECHYADTYNDSVRGPLLGEMKGVDRLLSGRLNYYSPYYRQCSLQSYLNDSTARARMAVAADDVRRAFAYYLSHLNPDRPFILAGYSQGAMIILSLLKDMDDATYRRMAAAYVIGATISQGQLDSIPRIVPARGADDTGVTVCYNSVRDTTCTLPLLRRSVVAINPVNWRTDATPATLVTVPSPLRMGKEQRQDTLTVTLNAPTGMLVVSGFTGTDYVLPLIGREGNYHSREVWLYRNELRENMQRRIDSKTGNGNNKGDSSR